MTLLPANAIRFGLHLLLAACLLLQATASLAMQLSMAAIADPPQAAVAADLPPCHAVLAQAAEDTAPPNPGANGGAPAHACCDEAGFCEWACAPLAPLAVLPTVPAAALPATAAVNPVILPPPGWPMSSPLRPPIA